MALASAFHLEEGRSSEGLEDALDALLAGVPNAVFYLIGPPKSPVGYALVSFGYALDLGGPTATIAELFIRPPVRGRGMGGEAVAALAKALSRHGIRALHIDAAAANPRASVFCRRLGFAVRDSHTVMTRAL
nr:GNAT family N-acetyltransferase [Oceaniglobus trochenteri]